MLDIAGDIAAVIEEMGAPVMLLDYDGAEIATVKASVAHLPESGAQRVSALSTGGHQAWIAARRDADDIGLIRVLAGNGATYRVIDQETTGAGRRGTVTRFQLQSVSQEEFAA